VFIHSGRPPCAKHYLELREIDRDVVKVNRVAVLLRAPGKMDVPVWNMTGIPLASAAR